MFGNTAYTEHLLKTQKVKTQKATEEPLEAIESKMTTIQRINSIQRKRTKQVKSMLSRKPSRKMRLEDI